MSMALNRRLLLMSALACGACSQASTDIQSVHVRGLVAHSTSQTPDFVETVIKENRLDDSDIPEALAYIRNHSDFTSYYLLMTVRTFYPAAYSNIRAQDKAAILCSALEKAPAMNDWGHLSIPRQAGITESDNALLETQNAALTYLEPILNDDREALCCGSEDATMSSVYQYRRKDFAYRYIMLIRGESPVFRDKPKDRDKDIDALKERLRWDHSFPYVVALVVVVLVALGIHQLFKRRRLSLKQANGVQDAVSASGRPVN